MTEKILDLTPLKKAIHSLQEVLAIPKNVIVRDASIQRFEYTYELCWKFLKRFLEISEDVPTVDQLSRHDLFRLGAEKGLIAEVTHWFSYREARNETSHTYNEEKAEKVYNIAIKFCKDAEDLLHELEKRNHAKN